MVQRYDFFAEKTNFFTICFKLRIKKEDGVCSVLFVVQSLLLFLCRYFYC